MRSLRPTPALAALAGLLPFFTALPAGAQPCSPDFTKGADASFIPQIEDLGGLFYSGASPRDPLLILRDAGFNTIRVRLWNNPPSGYCNTQQTLALAQRIRAASMGLLLDIHYSDTWADPGQQAKPQAWQNLSLPDLATAVRTFTRDTIAALDAQSTPPDTVQIGNEIIAGFLWNDGRVGGPFDANWPNLIILLNAAIAGVHDAMPANPPQVMLHIDRGGDNAGSRWFLDHLGAASLNYDLIGLSYYPWWHGSLEAMQANVSDLATRYHKPIVLVETAYPWTLEGADSQNNFVWQQGQLLPDYQATPAGQAAFLTAVLDTMRSLPNSQGRGVCYWAPELGAFPGLPSPWENLALFDFQFRALPSMEAFKVCCPADYNADGFIDGIDYDQFNNDFENPDPAQQARADFNGDGFVDGIDYDRFNLAFETGC